MYTLASTCDDVKLAYETSGCCESDNPSTHSASCFQKFPTMAQSYRVIQNENNENVIMDHYHPFTFGASIPRTMLMVPGRASGAVGDFDQRFGGSNYWAQKANYDEFLTSKGDNVFQFAESQWSDTVFEAAIDEAFLYRGAKITVVCPSSKVDDILTIISNPTHPALPKINAKVNAIVLTALDARPSKTPTTMDFSGLTTELLVRVSSTDFLYIDYYSTPKETLNAETLKYKNALITTKSLTLNSTSLIDLVPGITGNETTVETYTSASGFRLTWMTTDSDNVKTDSKALELKATCGPTSSSWLAKHAHLGFGNHCGFIYMPLLQHLGLYS